MRSLSYPQFAGLVESYGILPFSPFVPDHPSLTEAAPDNDWHTESASDPWQWLRIVDEGKAAYGKFLGSKACFIDIARLPAGPKRTVRGTAGSRAL